jgi:ribosomal protein L32
MMMLGSIISAHFIDALLRKASLPAILLFAVPKKKVTHSRKRQRQANNGLELKKNITTCPTCGGMKTLHYLCWNCFKKIATMRPT